MGKMHSIMEVTVRMLGYPDFFVSLYFVLIIKEK